LSDFQIPPMKCIEILNLKVKFGASTARKAKMAAAKEFLAEADLPLHMTDEVAACVKQAIKENMSPMKASKYVKSNMAHHYGGRWLAMCGRDFSSQLTPSTQRFALFRGPHYAVLIFQLPETWTERTMKPNY